MARATAEDQELKARLAEEKRLAEIAEQKRQAELAEQKRLAEIAEQERKAKLAEQKRLADLAAAQRKAELAAQKRQAELAALAANAPLPTPAPRKLAAMPQPDAQMPEPDQPIAMPPAKPPEKIAAREVDHIDRPVTVDLPMPTARPRIPAARNMHDRNFGGRHDKKYGKPTRATQKYERFRHAGRMSEPRRRQTYQTIKQRPRSYRAVQYPRRAPPRQRNAHFKDAWNDRH